MLCGERILQDVNSQVSITIRDFPMYRIISIEKSLIGKREKAPQSRVLLLCGHIINGRCAGSRPVSRFDSGCLCL